MINKMNWNLVIFLLFCALIVEITPAKMVCEKQEYNGRMVKFCHDDTGKDRRWKNGSKGSFTDRRDGQTYKTVKIGGQVWMAENLNYNYNEGSARSYCEENNCAKYGRLYTWSAAMDSAAVFSNAGRGCGSGRACRPRGKIRGVCPAGWHLPSTKEFSELMEYVYDNNENDCSLVSTDYGGTNHFGFSSGEEARFWEASENEENSALGANYLRLCCDGCGDECGLEGEIGLCYHYYKRHAYSVRCLKDSD